MKAHRDCARLRKPNSLQFMLGAGACRQHTSAAHDLALINMALRYRRGDFEVAISLERATTVSARVASHNSICSSHQGGGPSAPAS